MHESIVRLMYGCLCICSPVTLYKVLSYQYDISHDVIPNHTILTPNEYVAHKKFQFKEQWFMLTEFESPTAPVTEHTLVGVAVMVLYIWPLYRVVVIGLIDKYR